MCYVGQSRAHSDSYILHSCLSVSFPIHLIYLLSTTGQKLQPILSGLRFVVARQLSLASECDSVIQQENILTVRTAFIIIGLSVFYSLPSLLWFAAVRLASYESLLVFLSSILMRALA